MQCVIHTNGEFQLFGRFQEDGIVAELIRQKIDRKTFTFPPKFEEYFLSEVSSRGLSLSVTGEVKYDSAATAKIIELKDGDKLTQVRQPCLFLEIFEKKLLPQLS